MSALYAYALVHTFAAGFVTGNMVIRPIGVPFRWWEYIVAAAFAPVLMVIASLGVLRKETP